MMQVGLSKMKTKKTKTFIYEGLGFPIRLVNVPMKKMLGDWVMDVNLNSLQKAVLELLARKPFALSGAELRFIIDYLEMSTREFSKLFGVSHVAVLKWENEESKMNSSTEVYLRLYLMNYLKVTDKEFRKLYAQLSPQQLATESTYTPLEVDANRIAC
jgi:DNA-binding transcriptional regulator YiaG